MPRKIVEQSSEYPYHISARSNNREWFDQPKAKVFGLFYNVSEKTKNKYKLRIHSFVLMDNHFHMLVSTPEANLSECMRYFMTESSRGIARMSNRINRIYGKRYHWTIIREPAHYAHAYRYVYRNPVMAKLVTRVEEYSFSTINSQHSKWAKLIERNVEFDEYIPTSRKTELLWLNTEHGDRYEKEVQLGLKKHEFNFRQDRITGKRPSHIHALHPQNMPGTLNSHNQFTAQQVGELIERNVEFDEYIPTSRKTELLWLNTEHGDRYEKEVQLGLKKHEFNFRQDRITGKRPSHIHALHPQNMPGT